MMQVSIYYQATMPLLRGYEPGDTLILVVRGDIEIAPGAEQTACEYFWTELNVDDRPWGDRVRSMSMGDVVVLGEDAYTPVTLGFERVQLRPEDCHDGPFAPMPLGLLIPDIAKH